MIEEVDNLHQLGTVGVLYAPTPTHIIPLYAKSNDNCVQIFYFSCVILFFKFINKMTECEDLGCTKPPHGLFLINVQSKTFVPVFWNLQPCSLPLSDAMYWILASLSHFIICIWYRSWLHFFFFFVIHTVQKPREQVADAEALFDITNTLVTSVKAFNNEGVTPADFVNCLLRDFGQDGGSSSSQNESRSSIRWKDIGQVVSHVFRSPPGCCTM